RWRCSVQDGGGPGQHEGYPGHRRRKCFLLKTDSARKASPSRILEHGSWNVFHGIAPRRIILTCTGRGAIKPLSGAIFRGRRPANIQYLGGAMNQGDLIEKVASFASISKAEAERAINAVKGAITDSLRKGNKVTLVGFGTFGVSHRRARRGYDPYNSEIIKIP